MSEPRTSSGLVSTGRVKGARVAVIGCGIFGAMTALRLAESGVHVSVFERLSQPLLGASFNNQNRLHLGFHYPRDEATARQCIAGFRRFRDEFDAAILDGFTNAYFIASEGSLTSAEDYLRFCDRLELRYRVLDLAEFRPAVAGVDLGIAVEEVVYDCGILRGLIAQRLQDAALETHFSAEVRGISRTGEGFVLDVDGRRHGPFDAVVNCTYGDGNRLGAQLGHDVPERQYEYSAVPILEWDHPPVGITVMDGPFMTVLPFGKSGRFLLYHVQHTVVARLVAQQMPQAWRDAATSPAAALDIDVFVAGFIETCSRFVPDLVNARCVGLLQGPRVVLAHRDSTDARPSIVAVPEPGYISVFTGKIDHCVWVADEIAAHVAALSSGHALA